MAHCGLPGVRFRKSCCGMGEGILGCSCAPIGAVRAGPSHANKEEWGLEENGYLTPAWEACEPADTPARMSAAHANGSGSSASRASASSSTLDKGKGPATSSTATAADADLFDDAELDRIFNQEASQVAREAEVRPRRPSSAGGDKENSRLFDRLAGLASAWSVQAEPVRDPRPQLDAVCGDDRQRHSFVHPGSSDWSCSA